MSSDRVIHTQIYDLSIPATAWVIYSKDTFLDFGVPDWEHVVKFYFESLEFDVKHMDILRPSGRFPITESDMAHSLFTSTMISALPHDNKDNRLTSSKKTRSTTNHLPLIQDSSKSAASMAFLESIFSSAEIVIERSPPSLTSIGHLIGPSAAGSGGCRSTRL